MLETPTDVAQLIYSLLCMQDHLIDGVATIDNRVLFDADGIMFEVIVTRRQPLPVRGIKS